LGGGGGGGGLGSAQGLDCGARVSFRAHELRVRLVDGGLRGGLRRKQLARALGVDPHERLVGPRRVDPGGERAYVFRPRPGPQERELLGGRAGLALSRRQRPLLDVGRDAGDEGVGRQAVSFVHLQLRDPAGQLEPEISLLVFDHPLIDVRVGGLFSAPGNQENERRGRATDIVYHSTEI
jgi:hypothetical protein